ncbi:MAG: ACP S-malonyltransferase [Planctomycetota bacterium]
MKQRVALLCPGRGSYTEASLGSLPPAHALVRRAEAVRAEFGLESLVALDSAAKFSAARHLRPANVAALIFVATMLDATTVLEREHVVAVAGNSMGWYTGLAVAGALSFEDGFRLVQRMALFQEEGAPGGQVIYPLVDGDWQPSLELASALEAALGTSGGEAWPSIHLGGYAVLAGSPAGVKHLLAALPPVTLGKTTYPFQLARHGPYHTHLAAGVASEAQHRLTELEFRRPEIALIDGRGFRFSPWSSDLDALRTYTLGIQVTTPYDFTTSVRVALREYAPDELVLPGPGNSLGGVTAQILLQERWRGLATRADFDALQASDKPLVRSLRR